MIPINERNTIGEILEISDPVNVETAKKNYKRLLKLYHPDINKTKEAEDYTKKLNWAIAVVLGKAKGERPAPPPPRPQRHIIITYDFGFGYGGTEAGGWWSWTAGNKRSGTEEW